MKQAFDYTPSPLERTRAELNRIRERDDTGAGIPAQVETTFEFLRIAAADGTLILQGLPDKATGKMRYILAAVAVDDDADDGRFLVAPLAEIPVDQRAWAESLDPTYGGEIEAVVHEGDGQTLSDTFGLN